MIWRYGGINGCFKYNSPSKLTYTALKMDTIYGNPRVYTWNKNLSQSCVHFKCIVHIRCTYLTKIWGIHFGCQWNGEESISHTQRATPFGWTYLFTMIKYLTLRSHLKNKIYAVNFPPTKKERKERKRNASGLAPHKKTIVSGPKPIVWAPFLHMQKVGHAWSSITWSQMVSFVEPNGIQKLAATNKIT